MWRLIWCGIASISGEWMNNEFACTKFACWSCSIRVMPPKGDGPSSALVNRPKAGVPASIIKLYSYSLYIVYRFIPKFSSLSANLHRPTKTGMDGLQGPQNKHRPQDNGPRLSTGIISAFAYGLFDALCYILLLLCIIPCPSVFVLEVVWYIWSFLTDSNWFIWLNNTISRLQILNTNTQSFKNIVYSCWSALTLFTFEP